MDPLTAIANGLGELFGWFGAISKNNLAKKQQVLQAEYNGQEWYKLLNESSQRSFIQSQIEVQNNSQKQKIGQISIIGLIIIVIVLLIPKRK